MVGNFEEKEEEEEKGEEDGGRPWHGADGGVRGGEGWAWEVE